MHWARDDIINAYEMGLIDSWPENPDAQAQRRLAARLLADGLGLCPDSAPPEFPDIVADDPDRVWFGALYDEGILKGSDGGRMLPDATLTRAELAAILSRAAEPLLARSRDAVPFADLVGHWAASEVHSAYELGLIEGVGDSLFEPERPVTVAELLTMLVRMVLGEPSANARLPSNEVLSSLAARDLQEWARAYSQSPLPDWLPHYANRVGVGLYIARESAAVEDEYRRHGHTGAAVIESLKATVLVRRPLSALVELQSTGDSIWDGTTTEISNRSQVFIRWCGGRWMVYKSLRVQ